ncbi:hypothetical protein [Micromonospora tarapacensis]|uniref:hypothetical protein n=1 Tax=Micromonospora tarapacensis TaxID=2835305 RepID=UPI001E5E1814|nr:hypothetical protein [Micromonospora tarapacensis]
MVDEVLAQGPGERIDVTCLDQRCQRPLDDALVFGGHGRRELRLFSTITTFGSPMDITIDEVAIESYYPADAQSATYFTQ